MTQLDTNTSPYLDSAFANDRAHVFHSWSAQGALNPTVIAGAKGSRMWDEKGKSWLDFSSQLVNVNIGHQHPKLVAAIQEQAARLCTIAPFHANDMRSEAARLIAELAPGDLDMVFFTNGGTEAIENAVRLARGHTGRYKVLSTYRSYHGATGTSIQLTGDPRRWGNEPGMPGAHCQPRRKFVREIGGGWCISSMHRGGRCRAGLKPAPTLSRSEYHPCWSGNLKRSSAPTESWCHPTATSRACASCATSTAS